MKYLRFQLLAALLCLPFMGWAQNVLRVESVETPAGKTVTLPITMENQSDIAGVQFDIYVPFELVKDAANVPSVQLSKTRASSHTVAVRDMGSTWDHEQYYNSSWHYVYRYRIIVYSESNQLILDNEGQLLSLQLPIAADVPDDTQLEVFLENVTLSDMQMVNKLTTATNGIITIKEIPRPDLVPADITFTQTEVQPGGTLNVAWKVKNIGKADTDYDETKQNGWSEEITLVSNDGIVSKTVATTRYTGQLTAGSEVSRDVQIQLPELVGIDGITQVQVSIIPDAATGEHQSLRDNNTAKSTSNLMVGRKLKLEISPDSVGENYYWQRITLKLTRSGRYDVTQSFKVTATDSNGQPSTESRIPVPEIINIMENQSSAVLYLNITNNDVLDDDREINLLVEPINTANGYPAVTGRIVIEDDELPTLTLTASKTDLVEGTDQNFKLTVETERAPKQNLTVTITSENARRFTTFPATVTIPAGQTTAQMTVNVVNDDQANGTFSNKFTASAANHNKGEAIVILNDDDIPDIELTITPTQVQESDGPISVSATLRRISNIDKKVTVKLSDDANGGLYFGNRTLDLPKGTQEVNFNFGPVDNQEVDGDRTYTITAAVYLSSCSCTAAATESAGHVTAQLTVLDDDGKALRLTSANGTVKEGGTTTLTVTRNTNDNSEPVDVHISSDFDEQLSYTHDVTIPAGEKSVDVEITSLANAVANDSHTVIFTVEATDYSKGTCWVMVTDQTLPDATLPNISVNPQTVKVGEAVTLTLEVSNAQGNAELPAKTVVKVYVRGEKDAVASFTIDDALPIGQTKTLVKTVNLPKSVGEKQLYAVINEDKAVAELSASNNTSANVTVNVDSPFMAELATDKQIYNQNQVITFTGRLTGKDYANAEVDLYIVCDGTRQVEHITADADGQINYKWQLTTALSGHAIAGVCYPNAGATDEITSFDIYGLRRYNTSYIKHQLTVGQAVEAPIQLVNPGVLALTGVQVEVVEKPETYNVEANIPATIAGGVDNALLTYSITASAQSTGNNWEQVKLLVTSAEGIELPITIYCYARMAQANLVTPNQRITTTMTKGQTREYPIQLINNGQGHTGQLTLSLPDWMKCAQGNTLSGIEKGDTATIVLQFKPTDDMQLMVPVTGTIGFNVEYGNGTYANYSITPVSDQTGTLEVVVADEYTYYTDEKPYVSGADVVLRNSVTNAIVTVNGEECKGKSGADGKVVFENLPEGYYKLSVTADNHDSYTNNIVVDPGVTTTKTVNLSVQAVKVSWTVEETEIEDVYDIVTTVTFETNVPAPAVDLIVPNRIPADSLAEGESLVFYAIATNKGLINAVNTDIELPERTGIYLWEPLAENTGLTIAPQQSYIIPVKVTRMSPTDSRMRRAGADDGGCTTLTAVKYEWICGLDHKWNRVSKPITFKVCPGKGGVGGGGGWGGGGGGGLGWPGGGGGGGYSSTTYVTHVTGNDDCDPCLDAIGRWFVRCVENFIPIYGCVKGVTELAESDDSGLSKAVDTALTSVSCAMDACGVAATATVVGAGVGAACEIIGWVANGLTCYKSLWNASGRCWESYYHDKNAAGSRGPRHGALRDFTKETGVSWVDDFLRSAIVAEQELQGYYDFMTEVMGDTLWIHDTKMSEVENLLAVVVATEGYELNADELRQYKPDGITNEMFDLFIERINNTRRYDFDGTEAQNRIHWDVIEEAKTLIVEAEADAFKAGHVTVDEWFTTAKKTANDKLNEDKGTVCASISLQIKQTMTMTRQAFRGTLTVFNGHQENAMTDMKLNLVVSDLNNNVATSHEFQINAESLKGLAGELDLTSGWKLEANSEGTATILFIPTKYAAPSAPVQWSFGGTLSYVDPYSGLEVTRELYPVTMTVKPCPELDLTYFMQRDLYGDDPLTLDVIEPMEAGEFALLINNKGYGDATNVKMVTNQPEIVDNEKGLFIDFEIVSSQVNGGSAALSFGQTIANDLGDIPAHSQAYAQWWLQSSLLGHFTSYKVEATHVTSYGNEDLSLLDNVTIHELIHGFTPLSAAADATTVGRAFLVNDLEDAEDLPDQIYFTDATQDTVVVAQSATATKKTKTDYELAIVPGQTGWNYGSLLDPTAGKQKLLKVTRMSDNQEMPLDNFWQTSRSLRDGLEWLYENRLHFIAEIAAATGETFILTYEERPDVELDFQLSQPEYAPDFEKEGLVTSDVNEVTVTFTKAIDATTFTAEDVVYQVQGQKQDLTNLTITPKEGTDNTYIIGLGALNPALPNGYYVLSVQGAGITDYEGFNGLYGRKVDWVLFRGGLVEVHTKPYPANGGNIAWVVYTNNEMPGAARRLEPTGGSADKADYGTMIKLTATPSEGYEFVNWTLDGEVVSTDAEYIVIANSDMDFVANFKKKEYMVDVVAGSNGTLAGQGSGYYEYETELTIEARPDADFKLKGWKVDGVAQEATADNTLKVTVKNNMKVEAEFERDIFSQTITMANGWNWVSTFLKESADLGEMTQYADRIVGQTDELFRDPEYGLVGGINSLTAGQAFKVKANERFSRTLRGHLYGNVMDLKKGWNWMAYPFYEVRTIGPTSGTVITNPTEGDIITSQTGFSEYADGTWEPMLTLTPGNGYLYKSAADNQLTFDFVENYHGPAGARAASPVNSADVQTVNSLLCTRFPNTMNITARIYFDGMERPGQMYTIYAMANDELRGASLSVGQNHYLTVYGEGADDISFVIENAETGDTYTADQSLTFRSDVVGSRKAPYAFNIGVATGIGQLTDSSRPMTVYTLEGILISRDATLKTLHRLPKGVYIVNGQKCYVK